MDIITAESHFSADQLATMRAAASSEGWSHSCTHGESHYRDPETGRVEVIFPSTDPVSIQRTARWQIEDMPHEAEALIGEVPASTAQRGLEVPLTGTRLAWLLQPASHTLYFCTDQVAVESPEDLEMVDTAIGINLAQGWHIHEVCFVDADHIEALAHADQPVAIGSTSYDRVPVPHAPNPDEWDAIPA